MYNTKHTTKFYLLYVEKINLNNSILLEYIQRVGQVAPLSITGQGHHDSRPLLISLLSFKVLTQNSCSIFRANDFIPMNYERQNAHGNILTGICSL